MPPRDLDAGSAGGQSIHRPLLERLRDLEELHILTVQSVIQIKNCSKDSILMEHLVVYRLAEDILEVPPCHQVSVHPLMDQPVNLA